MLTIAQEFYNQKQYKKCFLKLIELSKELSFNENFLDLLLNVQIKMNASEGALKTVNVILSKNQNPAYLLIKLDLLMEARKYNEALDIALSLQDTQMTLQQKYLNFKNLVDIFIYFNDFDGLQELLDQNVIFDQTEAYFHFASGIQNFHYDNFDKSLENLRQAVALDPQLDKAWVSLAILHQKMGDFDLAFANIERALDINPANAVAVKCYVIWSEENGQYLEAFDKVTEYLSRNNFDHPMILKNISLMKKIGRLDLIKAEEVKFKEYFGQTAIL